MKVQDWACLIAVCPHIDDTRTLGHAIRLSAIRHASSTTKYVFDYIEQVYDWTRECKAKNAREVCDRKSASVASE